ncbi:TPA: hypothetical protein ACMD08_004555 [Vibrio parahaemolyticus]|uniref:hypothetical protein n=1 Tax=Vibrio parahaemolyticus TaxID=670 RepID=UPI00235E7F1C|nr:hypothetical protein [Vibrio parahaemolyticus]
MTSSLKTIIYALICFSVLVTSIIFATYFSVFNGEISTDSNDWANLGSYIGGLTTPVLSFCALIALLFSIYVQKIEFQALSSSQDKQVKLAEASHDSTLINNHKQTLLRFLEQFITSHQIKIQHYQLVIQEQRTKQLSNSPFYDVNQGQSAYNATNESLQYIDLATSMSLELTMQKFSTIGELNQFFAEKAKELKTDSVAVEK